MPIFPAKIRNKFYHAFFLSPWWCPCQRRQQEIRLHPLDPYNLCSILPRGIGTRMTRTTRKKRGKKSVQVRVSPRRPCFHPAARDCYANDADYAEKTRKKSPCKSVQVRVVRVAILSWGIATRTTRTTRKKRGKKVRAGPCKSASSVFPSCRAGLVRERHGRRGKNAEKKSV